MEMIPTKFFMLEIILLLMVLILKDRDTDNDRDRAVSHGTIVDVFLTMQYLYVLVRPNLNRRIRTVRVSPKKILLKVKLVIVGFYHLYAVGQHMLMHTIK